MGRNLYILAATLGFLALVCFVLSFLNIAQQPGSAGDTAMWRTMSIGLFLVAMIAALGANFSTLFGQAERRADEERLKRRKERRQE